MQGEKDGGKRIETRCEGVAGKEIRWVLNKLKGTTRFHVEMVGRMRREGRLQSVQGEGPHRCHAVSIEMWNVG